VDSLSAYGHSAQSAEWLGSLELRSKLPPVPRLFAECIDNAVIHVDSLSAYYAHVAQQLSLEGLKPKEWEDTSHEKLHKIVVPVSGLHQGTLAALHFARSMSSDVTAVIVDVEPERTARTQDKWPTWGHGVPLLVLESPYRSIIRPLMAFLKEQDAHEPERGLAVVVLPEFVPPHWWNHLFHNQTAIVFKAVLTYQRGKTGKGRVVINVPYHLEGR
jgi:hypothetical protein